MRQCENCSNPCKKRINIFCSRKCFGESQKKTHGLSGTTFYAVYSRIVRVCNEPQSDRYKYYGGRGVKCLWNSFEEFRDDMYESYKEHKEAHGKLNTTVERIDNNGHYSKENCRWATRREQAENRTSSIKIQKGGENFSIKKWARQEGVSYWRLWHRIRKKKMGLEEALKDIRA